MFILSLLIVKLVRLAWCRVNRQTAPKSYVNWRASVRLRIATVTIWAKNKARLFIIAYFLATLKWVKIWVCAKSHLTQKFTLDKFCHVGFLFPNYPIEWIVLWFKRSIHYLLWCLELRVRSTRDNTVWPMNNFLYYILVYKLYFIYFFSCELNFIKRKSNIKCNTILLNTLVL